MRPTTTATLWLFVTAMACGLLFAVVRCDLNVASQWEKTDLRLLANETGGAEYVPDNNLVYRMRVWADTAYMVVPRFRSGVPATLCATPVRGDGGPLRPYPSLGLQTPGNCIGLQNVVDIEIDHLGQLWTLDRGRAAPANESHADDAVQCDPKLFVVDTGTGRVVRSAVMPPAVYTSRSVLSGLTIDLKTLTAVVADVGPDDPGFIAYDFRSGIYRKFRCAALVRRRRPRPTASAGTAATEDNPRKSDGDDDYSDDDYDEAILAASPIDDQLYFTAVGLDAVYAIPLSVFSAPPLYGRDVDHYASVRGELNGTATAAVMDTAGNLYVAIRPGHKVVAWNTLRRGFDAADAAVREVRLDWVSGLALDARGYLWIVTSAFHEFMHAGFAANARLFRRYCGTTAFALQETAANLTASGDDDTAVSGSREGRNAAARVITASSIICCVAAALLWVTWKTA